MTETMPQKSSAEKDCFYWLQFFLARRSHSEQELIEKLSKKGFSDSEISSSLDIARMKKWLEDPYDLAMRTSEKWHQKFKSHAWISNYLREKGLPDLDRDSSLEIQKASSLLEKKFGKIDENNYNKARGFLASKGFTEEDFEDAQNQI